MKLRNVLWTALMAVLMLSGCESGDTKESVPAKGNVNGIVVAPDVGNEAVVSCGSIPIPGGYHPLSDVNVTFQDANGLVVAWQMTDSCGRFYTDIETAGLDIIRIAKEGYHSMLSDIHYFDNGGDGWGIVSTAENNNSFAARINDNAESLTYQPENGKFKYTIVDTVSGRAVLGIPERAVSVYKNVDMVSKWGYIFNDLDADVVMTLDASGSMTFEWTDINGTSIGTSFDLTYAAAKQFIDELSGKARLGVTIFDDSIDFVTPGFISNLELSGAFAYADDGFESNKVNSKFIIDIYHPNSHVYEANSTLIPEYPYTTAKAYQWGGLTAYFDAAATGVSKLDARGAKRKIGVLMTDGSDNSSTKTLQDVIAEAQDANVTFYTISIGTFIDPNLQSLADATGGVYIQANGDDLGDKFSDILSEIQYFYEVGTDVDPEEEAYYRVDVLVGDETVSALAYFTPDEGDDNNSGGDNGGDGASGIDGAQLFMKCMPCHGNIGDESAYGVSAIINQMNSETLKARMNEYKAGTLDQYGYGALMQKQLETYSDEAVDVLADYIASLGGSAPGHDDCVEGETSLQGSIYDAVTLLPLAGVSLHLEADSGEEGLDISTDENGTFITEALTVGDYNITIGLDGYLPVSAAYDVQEGCINAFGQLLLIPDDQAGVIVPFSGNIIDAVSGETLEDVTIELYAGYYITEGNASYGLVSDANGSFDLSVETGYYTAKISKDGYVTSDNIAFSVFGERYQKDFTLAPTVDANQVRVVLTWAEHPEDLDSHLSKMRGNDLLYHVYFAHPQALPSEVSTDESAILDVDDVTSYGPETITITNLDPTVTYKYYVHHYFGTGSIATTSQATVTVYTSGQVYTFRAPEGNGSASVWKVFELANGVITPCYSGCLFSDESFTLAPSLDTLPGLQTVERSLFEGLMK